jgi:hypothetical protein
VSSVKGPFGLTWYCQLAPRQGHGEMGEGEGAADGEVGPAGRTVADEVDPRHALLGSHDGDLMTGTAS